MVGLDSRARFFNRRRSASDEFYYLRKVQYRSRELLPAAFDITGEDLLITKGIAWDYEREWRVLAPVQDTEEVVKVDGDVIHLFSFPPSMVRVFLLGAKTKDEFRTAVRDVLKRQEYFHMQLGSMVLSDTDLSIDWS